MPWNFDPGRPIYSQLLEMIRLQIVSGRYAPGEKLPSVRDLASEAAVNPNTMQRALTELERTGLIYAQRTSGRYVTEDSDMIASAKRTIAREKTGIFLQEMKQLGYGPEQVTEIINTIDSSENADQNVSDSDAEKK